jgi:hypothetical protein
MLFEEYNYGDVPYTVVQEGIFEGGSKSRVMERVIREIFPDATHIVYAGCSIGYAMVAISEACKKLEIEFTIFTTFGNTKPMKLAKKNGARVIQMRDKFSEIQKVAEQFSKQNGASYFPFGGNCPEFIRAYVEAICPLVDRTYDGIIYIACGSCTILQALYEIFPSASFMAVQVGKKIWPDQINDRTRIYISPYKFYEACPSPPYETVLQYDGKAYHAMIDDLKNSTRRMIWNIAK